MGPGAPGRPGEPGEPSELGEPGDPGGPGDQRFLFKQRAHEGGCQEAPAMVIGTCLTQGGDPFF